MSRPPTYSYVYAAKYPAIPRASARQYIPRSVPSLQKDCNRSHCYVSLSSRDTSPLHSGDHHYINICTGGTYISRRHRSQQHVITILYNCSSVVKSLVSPLRSGDHRYIYICVGATYLSRHRYPVHLLQRRQIANPTSYAQHL